MSAPRNLDELGASYHALAVHYSKLPQFKKYDLEDGWLLDVREGDSFEFIADAALTYAHPIHQRTLWMKIRDALVRDLPPYQFTPKWARILIVFPKVRSAKWIKRTMRPNVDPDGSIDYGSTEEFTVEGNTSHLSGEWGELELFLIPLKCGKSRSRELLQRCPRQACAS